MKRLLAGLFIAASLALVTTAASASTPLRLKSVTNPEHSGGAVTLTGTGFTVGDSIKWVMTAGPTTVAKPLTVTPTKLTTKAPFAPGAGTHAWSVAVIAPKSIISNRLTVKVITGLQLVSISPADAYNCHMVTLHGSGLAGVNLVWFGSSYQKPSAVTSTQIQVEVSEFVENGSEVVAEDPSGLHSNPLVITILPGGC
ncbi:MAG: IPT/TIG domain-containing protein [Acidimicrobiales bacterium]